MDKRSKGLHFYVTPDEYQALVDLAKQVNVSLSGLLRFMLQYHLQQTRPEVKLGGLDTIRPLLERFTLPELEDLLEKITRQEILSRVKQNRNHSDQ